MFDRDTRVVGNDLDLMRRMVFDAFCHSGITAEYFEINSNDNDLYNDPNCTWKEGVMLDVGFEENPKVKLIKDLGWYNEDEEIRPQIMYVPMYKDFETKELLRVVKNCLVKISYFGMQEPAEFRITDLKMDSVYGCYYICKLAPEKIVLFETELKDGNYYLNKKDIVETGENECEHYFTPISDIGGEDSGEVETEVVKPYGTDMVNGGVADNYDDYSKLVMGG